MYKVLGSIFSNIPQKDLRKIKESEVPDFYF
jgi:hypothetical protein